MKRISIHSFLTWSKWFCRSFKRFRFQESFQWRQHFLRRSNADFLFYTSIDIDIWNIRERDIEKGKHYSTAQLIPTPSPTPTRRLNQFNSNIQSDIFRPFKHLQKERKREKEREKESLFCHQMNGMIIIINNQHETWTLLRQLRAPFAVYGRAVASYLDFLIQMETSNVRASKTLLMRSMGVYLFSDSSIQTSTPTSARQKLIASSTHRIATLFYIRFHYFNDSHK